MSGDRALTGPNTTGHWTPHITLGIASWGVCLTPTTSLYTMPCSGMDMQMKCTHFYIGWLAPKFLPQYFLMNTWYQCGLTWHKSCDNCHGNSLEHPNTAQSDMCSAGDQSTNQIAELTCGSSSHPSGSEVTIWQRVQRSERLVGKGRGQSEMSRVSQHGRVKGQPCSTRNSHNSLTHNTMVLYMCSNSQWWCHRMMTSYNLLGYIL